MKHKNLLIKQLLVIALELGQTVFNSKKLLHSALRLFEKILYLGVLRPVVVPEVGIQKSEQCDIRIIFQLKIVIVRSVLCSYPPKDIILTYKSL